MGAGIPLPPLTVFLTLTVSKMRPAAISKSWPHRCASPYHDRMEAGLQAQLKVPQVFCPNNERINTHTCIAEEEEEEEGKDINRA